MILAEGKRIRGDAPLFRCTWIFAFGRREIIALIERAGRRHSGPGGQAASQLTEFTIARQG